jgi:16S rRNA (uracil1498-N3)-methyltransferase
MTAMRLTRVFVSSGLREGAIVELPAETASHVAKVLRARAGDALVLFGGDGREFTGEIQSVRGARVQVALGAARSVDRESPLDVTLLQCVPRGDRMDFIVQKATELGVRRIVPLLCQRSVVRLGEGQAASKAAHWRGVAVSACEQCGRNRLPAIDAPLQLEAFLGTAPAQPALRLVLEPDSVPGGLQELAPGTAVEIAIGPEGGFSPEELEAFRVAGFRRAGLGPRILRTETAAIAALAWLQSRYGDLGEP